MQLSENFLRIFNFLKFLSLLNVILSVPHIFLDKNYPVTVIEDSKLDTAGLLNKYKYPVEKHYVTTADNYILCMHRIPKPGGQPIFLMHGILDSSATWIIMGPWSGLGYYLYENGYDVWMGNARGNFYSRNHTTMDPDTNDKFWKFSWHEIGIYDLHAMIDYVLQKTNRKNLTYIGHSQGTTSFFVMCSMHPDCNSKIRSMHAIAPVAFMKHIKTPLVSFGKIVTALLGENFPELLPIKGLLLYICFISYGAINTCMEVLYQLLGKETKQINTTMFPVIFGHIPAGAAVRQVKHYLQLVDSDRFCQFDFGASENLKQYGRVTPPDYPLENIKIPIGLHYTLNDYLANEKDVQRLARLLPNVIDNNLLRFKKWSHITPVWGTNARELLHKRIIEMIRKF